MKRIPSFRAFLPLLLLLWSPIASGQADFRSIDRHARKAPAELQQNLPALTEYLVQPCQTDLEKVRAIYAWITQNIRYDDEAYQQDVRRINQHNADILGRRRAVCFGYATLFRDMCAIANLEAQVVSGYSKGVLTSTPDLEEADHAWNSVRIAGKWQLLDATWGSSLIDKNNEFVLQKEDEYFLSEPQRFVLSHLPNLPMWQLLDCPVTPGVFQQSPDRIEQYLSADTTCYAYADSIHHFLSLPPAQRRLWEAEGAYRFNPTTANRQHFGHSLMDFAAHRTDQADRLQTQPGQTDSLLLVQDAIIQLCERAFSLMTPYDWQKELYINTLINQAVALYQHSARVEKPAASYERALKCLSTSRELLDQLPEDSYFANYARRQYQRIRPVIEEALKR